MRATFIRSDAMAERNGGVEEVVYEADWFQLTYNAVRIAPDGEEIAVYLDAIDAWIVEGETLYSDVVFAN